MPEVNKFGLMDKMADRQTLCVDGWSAECLYSLDCGGKPTSAQEENANLTKKEKKDQNSRPSCCEASVLATVPPTDNKQVTKSKKLS